MVLEKERFVGLYPSQYKAYEIIREADKPLTEKEIRERWNGNHINYTSNDRKSPVYQELKALLELSLITKEKKGNSYQYRIKPKRIGFGDYNPSPLQLSLIQYILEHGPTTRKVFVKELKTPRTTIYDNLVKLQKQKIVEKFSRNEGKRGRPIIYWRIKDIYNIDLNSVKSYIDSIEFENSKEKQVKNSNKDSSFKFMNEV